MTVYENILLGHEIRKGIGIDWNKMIVRSNELLAKVRLKVNPETKVKDLGVGKRQLVEIAKALSRDVSLLILDEPTAALNEDDCDNLLDLIQGLKKSGVTCVLISHKLKEVIRIADKVTVLRDGKTIVTLDAHKGEVNENILIKHMVGREITNIYPLRENREKAETSAIALETRHWSAIQPQDGRKVLDDISIIARKSEIIGIAGLMGSGRTEFARSVFGNPDGYHLSGELLIAGKPVKLRVAASYLQSRLTIRLAQRTTNIIRGELFGKMQALPLKFFDTNTHGELMSRYTNDVDNVQLMLEQSLTQLVSSVLTFVGSIVMMVILSPLLFAFTALVLVLMIFMSTRI